MVPLGVLASSIGEVLAGTSAGPLPWLGHRSRANILGMVTRAFDHGGRTGARLLARGIFGLALLSAAGGLVFGVLDAQHSNGAPLLRLSDLPFLIAFAAFPIVGYVLASRRPENAISWLVLGIGAAFGLDILMGAYSTYAIHGGVGGYRMGAILAGLEGPMWVPIVAIPATFLILLFPSGHLPSPRWRWFARILAAGLVLVFLGILFSPGKLDNSAVPGVENPLGVDWLRPLLPLALALIALLPIGIVVSLVSLVRRYRRSTGVERLQLRWLVTAAGIVALLYAIALPIGLVTGWNQDSGPVLVALLQNVAIVSFALIPIAIGVSVLRYRLLDIDVVVSRALLFGALAIFITAVYVGIVVGVGAVVGSRANPVLSAAAAAVVALAFQPVRRRAQRLADRLVYGKRATPYEVLSEFSERLGKNYATDELLPKMARALADGTAAARADVWVRVGDQLRPEATWPSDAEPASPIPASNADGSAAQSSMLEPVRHDGELLGALSFSKKVGESVTATEERLVRDLAAQAGLVMRNVALTERLVENIEQLRASRQRLVTAQDEERRKIERNLHDGAQQQIVALAVKLRLLEQLIGRDAEKAKAMAASLHTDTGEALQELRDLARGIYPPLLADKGLIAALESQAGRSVVPVTIEAGQLGRYPREIEAAVYFSCLEALQNVAKYAEASGATLRLSDGDGRLRFEVTDDGVGFEADQTPYGTGLQGIADRLSALGGEVSVRSTPGAGTSVAGELPIAESSG
jgi:signal transduction histidine kinase